MQERNRFFSRLELNECKAILQTGIKFEFIIIIAAKARRLRDNSAGRIKDPEHAPPWLSELLYAY